MRNEDEIFDMIKNSPEVKPRVEFVNQTKINLIKQAKRLNRKQKVIKSSYYWSGILTTIVVIAWIAFFGGSQYVADSVNQVMASITKTNNPSTSTTDVNPSVFIYHTHNTESFTPLLNIDDPRYALDNKKNITLVGNKLAESLEEKNINTLHNKSNIQQILEKRDLGYADSYLVTKDIIKKTLNENKDIKLIMDIHRDSKKRYETTVEINDESVSRINFVVSHISSKYEENRYIAELFHNKLEEKYPGISGGIYTMGQERKNTYNQDLFKNSLLLEIGGPENTLEEEYRSVEILSEVIDDVLNEIE